MVRIQKNGAQLRKVGTRYAFSTGCGVRGTTLPVGRPEPAALSVGSPARHHSGTGLCCAGSQWVRGLSVACSAPPERPVTWACCREKKGVLQASSTGGLTCAFTAGLSSRSFPQRHQTGPTGAALPSSHADFAAGCEPLWRALHPHAGAGA